MSTSTSAMDDKKTLQEKIIWEVCDNPTGKPNKNNVCLNATAFTYVSFAKENIAVICLALTNNTPKGTVQIYDSFLKACIKQYKCPFKLSYPESPHLTQLGKKHYVHIFLGKMSEPVAKRFFERLAIEGIDNKSPDFLDKQKTYSCQKASDEYNDLYLKMMTTFYQKEYKKAIKIAETIHTLAVLENEKKTLFALHTEGPRGLDDSDAALVLGIYLKTNLAVH